MGRVPRFWNVMYGPPLSVVPPRLEVPLLFNPKQFHAASIGRKVAIEAVVIPIPGSTIVQIRASVSASVRETQFF